MQQSFLVNKVMPHDSGTSSRLKADATASILPNVKVGDLTGLGKKQKKSAAVSLAIKDSKRLNPSKVKLYSDGTPTIESTTPFVRSLSKAEQKGLLDQQGLPTRAAQNRLQNALLYAGYGDEQLIRLRDQASTPNSESVITALTKAASQFASLKGKGKYDVRNVVCQVAQGLIQHEISPDKTSNWKDHLHFALNSAEKVQMARTIADLMADHLAYKDRLTQILTNIGKEFKLAYQEKLQLSSKASRSSANGSGVVKPTPQAAFELALEKIQHDLAVTAVHKLSHSLSVDLGLLLSFSDDMTKPVSDTFRAAYDRYYADSLAEKKSTSAYITDLVLSIKRSLAADAADDTEWVTVHPNGDDEKGQPVLIEKGTGIIRGGLGGKYNGQRLDEISKSKQSQSAKKLLGYTGSVRDGFKAPSKEEFDDMLNQVTDASKRWHITQGFIALSNPNWVDLKGRKFENVALQNLYDQIHREVQMYDAMKFIGAHSKSVDDNEQKQPTKEMVARGERAMLVHTQLLRKIAEDQLPKAKQALDAQIKEATPLIKRVCGNRFKAESAAAAKTLHGELFGEIDKMPFSLARKSYGKKMLESQLAYISANLGSDDLAPPSSEPAVALFIKSKLLSLQCWCAYNLAIGENKQTLLRYVSEADTKARQAQELMQQSLGVTSFAQAFERGIGKIYQKLLDSEHAYAPSEVAGVARAKPMSFAEANELKGNPYFNAADLFVSDPFGGRYFPYRINCQACVVSNEMRRRGYDVEAQANIIGGHNMCGSLSKFGAGIWFNPVTGAPPDVIKISSFADLDELVQESQRFALMWKWKLTSATTKQKGHIVSILREQGKCCIYDPQSGEKSSLADFQSEYGHKINMSTLSAFRIDNCEIMSGYADHVLVKAHQGAIVYGQK